MERTLAMIVLAGMLGGCGGDVDQTASARQELGAAPSASQLAALELPGCEALDRLVSSPSGRFRIVEHAADRSLAVLLRDGCPLCIDTPKRAREELRRLYPAAAIETPALISAPIDDDPVPIREERNAEGGAGAESQDPSGDEQQPPPGGGNGSPSNPQLASSPVPNDDPVPIRGLAGHLVLIGSTTTASKK